MTAAAPTANKEEIKKVPKGTFFNAKCRVPVASRNAECRIVVAVLFCGINLLLHRKGNIAVVISE